MTGKSEMKSSLFGFAGMFLGGLLTWIVIAPASAEPAAPTGTSTDELLASQLRSEQVLQEIARALPSLSAGETVTPSRSPAAGELQPDLLTRLEFLDGTLARLTSALGSTAGPNRISTPLSLGTTGAADKIVLRQIADQETTDVDLKHIGWTMQQVLDTYGRPNESYANDEAVELRWFFDMDKGSLGFYFIDGRVVSVQG